MKQRPLLILGLFACLILFAGFFPVSWGADPIFRVVASQIESKTGLRMNAPGSVGVSLLPMPRLKLTGLSLADENGREILRAPVARIEMRILPLLAGNFEISELLLVEPRMDVSQTAASESWMKLGRRIALGVDPSERSSAGRQIGRVVFFGGQIALPGGEAEQISGLSGLVSWPRYGQALEAWINGAWRGEKFEARLGRLLPKSLGEGAASPVSLALRSTSADLLLDGEAFQGNELSARGNIVVNLRGRVENTARWLGLQLPLSTWLHDIALSGEGSLHPRRLSLTSAVLSAGSSRFEGTLAVGVENGRPSVDGTLAADTVDVADLSARTPRLTDSETWTAASFGADDLKSSDFDLRLSASQLIYRQTKLDDVALSALLKGGRLEVTLGRASAFKGTMRARLGLQAGEAGLEAKLQGNLDKIDAAAASAELAGSRRLSGTATLQVALEGSGRTLSELIGNLSGKTSTVLKPGEIGGLNIADLARRNERKPTPLAEASASRTVFESLNATGTITGGVLDLVADGILHGSAMRAVLGGKISLPGRSFALSGQVQPANGNPPASSLWPFEITGPLAQPVLTPTLTMVPLRDLTTGSVRR